MTFFWGGGQEAEIGRMGEYKGKINAKGENKGNDALKVLSSEKYGGSNWC
jgi:hypothetical protein